MAKIRYVCLDCNKKGKGGYFSVEASEEEVKCPYCGSTKVKRLGSRSRSK